MQILEKQEPKTPSGFALFELGFRAFFLGAGIFAIVSISLWSAIYLFGFSLPINGLSMSQWHAHEMIFGYTLAVIAGFLLTAVKNWTGINPINSSLLSILFALWFAARLCFIFASNYLWVAAWLDLLFSSILLVAVCRPIFIKKQWKQLAIVSKLLIILAFNGLFYAGVLGWLEQGVFWGIYGGLYIVLGLILTMGRRVIPAFIKSGVGYPVSLFNSKWLDISNLLLFLGFFISEIFLHDKALSAYLSLALFAINAFRLLGWHTIGIWHKSLLWSIYLSFWFITFGFLLFAASYWFAVSPFLSIHAFAYGGVGLITIGMMSRVSLGHTGRNVAEPPKAVGYGIGLLLLGAIVRVVMPLVAVAHYSLWIGLSQLLWVAAFVVFLVVYTPILIKPRLE